ncbi:co-chaperonin GroES (HSP10) [Bradyrhizobium sp. USDA 4473]
MRWASCPAPTGPAFNAGLDEPDLKPSLQEDLQEGTSWLNPISAPCTTRVVVKRIDAEEKSKGGIIIPDSAKEKPSQGEIVAVGPGGRDEAGKLIPIDLKVGDRVLFGKWSGTEVKLDNEELLIMKESDIMGVLA